MGDASFIHSSRNTTGSASGEEVKAEEVLNGVPAIIRDAVRDCFGQVGNTVRGEGAVLVEQGFADDVVHGVLHIFGLGTTVSIVIGPSNLRFSDKLVQTYQKQEHKSEDLLSPTRLANSVNQTHCGGVVFAQ